MNEVIIIGGGAAGLMAAVSAAQSGAKVTLLERNEKLGKKIYITGKGRCNATNACDAQAFMKNVVKNPRFLFSALNALAPSDLMQFLEDNGCPVVVERGDRVFPESQKASDVTRAFEKALRRLNVNVRLHCRVLSIDARDGQVTGVTLENGTKMHADAVIVCTGGQSYVSTGSTGDGWKWLSSLGHTVFPPLPSLVGLTSDEKWVCDLQGLSLKNVRLTLTRGKKKLYTELGEMLCTHFGVSGPLILSTSAYITELAPEDVTISIDLKPGLNAQQLDARIQRDIAESPKKQLGNLLCGLFPARLAEAMAQLCQLDPNRAANTLTREERARLVETTQHLVIPVSGTRSLNEAIVTRGGVSVKEIDPSTMESRLVKGLYVAGELLDVDALTGGFNLHIAFSTGFVAGREAAVR